MSKFEAFLIHTFTYTMFVLLDSFLGWWILDEFGLSYWTWFGIAVVSVTIVRSGVILNDLYNELTAKTRRAKI